MKLIISYLKPYRIAIGIAVTLMLIELTVELLNPLLMAKIIDEGILRNDLGVVIQWGSIMLGFSLISFASGIANSFYSAHVSQSYGDDIRKSVFKKIQFFSFTSFNKFSHASLITRLTNDVTQTQNAIFMSLRIMLRAPLLVIGSMLMALSIDIRLGFIILGTVPVLIFFIWWTMKKGRRLFQSVQEKLDRVNGVMRESLIRLRLIRAYNTDEYESELFTKASEELRDRMVTSLRFMELTMPILLLVMNASILAILWFGSEYALSGSVKEGEVIAIINYATRITAALSMFSFITSAFTRAKASALRLTEVLECDSDTVDNEGVDDSEEVSNGEIAVRNVSFNYPNAHNIILRNISFIAPPGEKIAILGETGSGKSTLLQLIPRLYEVTDGSIQIDGHDIRDIDEVLLRNSMGYVGQVPFLFTGTIRDNIAWGKEAPTMNEIIEAAKDAQIFETITSLSNGFETVIGQKGVNLSGGQKQRVSIARALIRKPKILLLDDCTSALDIQTEHNLLKALNKYECTTFIITSKISTALSADKILIISGGKLIAQGTHDELIQKVHLYQQIYYSQYGKERVSHV